MSDEKYVHPKGKSLDERGREILDSTPVAPPVGFHRQPSLAEQIRLMVRSERLRQEVENAGMETFDEAEDFDVDGDIDPSSPYEQHFDPTPVEELRRRRDEDIAKSKSPPVPEPNKNNVSDDKSDPDITKSQLRDPKPGDDG